MSKNKSLLAKLKPSTPRKQRSALTIVTAQSPPRKTGPPLCSQVTMNLILKVRRYSLLVTLSFILAWFCLNILLFHSITHNDEGGGSVDLRWHMDSFAGTRGGGNSFNASNSDSARYTHKQSRRPLLNDDGINHNETLRSRSTLDKHSISGNILATASADTVSACLLVNDENPRLPEWLAYHYHILPLRSLIVAIDPASRTSPVNILSRWTNSTMMMDIVIWDNEDYYMPPEQPRGACDASDSKHACHWTYVNRQNYFIMECMAEFKRRNKTWVVLVDVDEYVTFNQIREDDPVAPLDKAPDGVPTLRQWTIDHGYIQGVKRTSVGKDTI